MAKNNVRRDEAEPIPGVGSRNHDEIAIAAYYRAERRGFAGDRRLEDWLEAERELGVSAADGPARDELAAREHVEEDIKPDQIEQWAQKLGVTAEQLRVAVQRVGPSSAQVRAFFENGKREAPAQVTATQKRASTQEDSKRSPNGRPGAGSRAV